MSCTVIFKIKSSCIYKLVFCILCYIFVFHADLQFVLKLRGYNLLFINFKYTKNSLQHISARVQSFIREYWAVLDWNYSWWLTDNFRMPGRFLAA